MYLTWCAWFKEEWNRPDRADYYRMQIGLRIRQTNSKSPGGPKLEEEKIPFVFTSEEEQENPLLSKGEIRQLAKEQMAIWAARTGLKMVNRR